MSEGRARAVRRKARRAARRRKLRIEIGKLELAGKQPRHVAGLTAPRREDRLDCAMLEVKDPPAARFVTFGRKEARTLLRRYALRGSKGPYKVRAYRKGASRILEIMERPKKEYRGQFRGSRISASGRTWAGAWIRMRAELFGRITLPKRIIRPEPTTIIVPDARVARELEDRMRGATR